MSAVVLLHLTCDDPIVVVVVVAAAIWLVPDPVPPRLSGVEHGPISIIILTIYDGKNRTPTASHQQPHWI